MKTKNKPWMILCWAVVIVIAALLRFENLSDRPFHFDEATGARITSQRMTPTAGYQFNPVHNHGPSLSAAAAPICHLVGESTWQKMSKLALRLVPAIAGTLLVMVPLLWRRRLGDAPMLAAATLLATSPLLVYYSRMFIHEMLLALFGLAAVVLLCGKIKTVKYAVIGVLIGLMFATKESFAISIIAWSGAGIILAAINHKKIHRLNWKSVWLLDRKPITVGLVAAALTSILFYTDGLSNPKGAWDAVRTFFIYKTESGHDKAFFYYLDMLVVPTKAAIWWYETPVFILAALALLRTHLPGSKHDNSTNIIRFLAYSAIFHLLIYSIISYKTPWLMCLPWAHVCLLAGFSLHGFSRWKTAIQVVAVVIFAGVLAQQVRLTYFANGRFASDTRNPYAYVPTSRDVESLEKWLKDLAVDQRPGALEPIAVVGSHYWPLPWYLRDFESIGYWTEPDPAITDCPVVLAMPEVAHEINTQLEKTHIAFPRSLRAKVPVMLYLRKDHWERWISPEHPTSR